MQDDRNRNRQQYELQHQAHVPPAKERADQREPQHIHGMVLGDPNQCPSNHERAGFQLASYQFKRGCSSELATEN